MSSVVIGVYSLAGGSEDDVILFIDIMVVFLSKRYYFMSYSQKTKEDVIVS